MFNFRQLISKVALGQAEYFALFRAELHKPGRNGPSVRADQDASEWDRFKMWTTLSRDVTDTQGYVLSLQELSLDPFADT